MSPNHKHLPSTALAYRAEIDGLRALAVFAAILFHAGFSAFGGGFVGVDVYFVISGYLLASKALVGLGLISYSAYLWHQPVLAFLRHGSPQAPGKHLLALVAFGSGWLPDAALVRVVRPQEPWLWPQNAASCTDPTICRYGVVILGGALALIALAASKAKRVVLMPSPRIFDADVMALYQKAMPRPSFLTAHPSSMWSAWRPT